MRRFADSRLTLSVGAVTAVVCLCATRTQAQDRDLKPTFGAVALKAGFLPDPFVKKLTAGGPLRTNLGGVQAHVAQAPDFQLFYDAGNFPLTIHVESAADTTLLINLPDGSWIANDDGPNNGLNPLLQFGRPQSGRYDIWVGTLGKDLAPARLLITELKTAGPLPGQRRADVYAIYKAAMKLDGQGQFAEAAQEYEKAVRLARQVLGEDHPDTATLLNNLAVQYQNLGEYGKAEPLVRRSLDIREAKLGKDHPDTAHSLNSLGVVCKGLGQFAKAEPLLRRSLDIREAKLGKDHLDTATTLSNLASLYQDMGKYAKAEPLYRRCLDIRAAKLGKDHLETATTLNNLGSLYRDMGQYAKAEPLFGRCLEIREAKLGKDHPDTATILNHLANLYRGMGQYARAEPLFRRCLDIYEAKLGKDHLHTATALNGLASLYRDMGQYARAERLYRRSLDIREAKLGKDHLDTAPALNNLANLYRDMGQYAKAEPLLHRCLDICEAKLTRDHPKTAVALNNLASFYRDMGQFAKAEPLYRRSLDIHEATLGKDHPETAHSLNNLAVLYRDMGQYTKAEPLYRRCLDINEATLGKDHPKTATTLNNLGGLYHAMGQDAKAESLSRRCLDIYEATLGKDHPQTATALINLGGLYHAMGQDAKAEPLYRRSLDIYEAKLGKDHPTTAKALNHLALFYSAMGERAKAEPLLQRALKIFQATFGKDHRDVTRSLHYLAWNAASRKEWTTAVEYAQVARRGHATHVAALLPVLSEKEQLQLLQADFIKAFHTALSLGWTARKEAGTASAEWLLNGKAVAHQSLAEQQLLARDAREPKARQLVEDLQEMRSRLAALINRLPEPGLEREYQQQVQALKASEQDLARKLARAVGRPYRANPWLPLDELRAKLRPKTAFVDVARVAVFDFEKNKRQAARYVAWITPPQGKDAVQMIDLGEAEPIDQLVEQTRKTLIESAKSITKVGEIEASEALRKPLQELSAKVLHPLLPPLAKYEEWIVCPDGALWLTPWNALLLPDGKFAVEKHLIRHVVSGRDLVLELPKAKAESACIFADPDYDLNPSKVLVAAGGLRGLSISTLLGQRLAGTIGSAKVFFDFREDKVVITGELAGEGTWKQQGNALTIQTKRAIFQGTIEATEIRGQRSLRNDDDGSVTRDTFRIERPRQDDSALRSAGAALGTLPKVPRLPGTAAEAAAVRVKLQQWLGQEPKVFLEGQASEAMLKTVKNPRVLTLATHGYFLPAQEMDQKDRPGLDLDGGKHSAALFDKKGQAIENPLLRCGLLLAGCNKRAEAKTGEDDGILTGLEIVGLDLNGCELVVLSACETGLGEVRNGEGVAGLRQAFQLAGAKGVLASLWQVPDRETALLMNTFYGEIARGRSQAEALRHAQLQRIAARQEQFGAAHPFFWAAFALTTRGGE